MDEVEFNIYEDFEQPLADKFAAFMNDLPGPCLVKIDIESPGGYCHILEEMEQIVTQKKAEGFVFLTNVDLFAYSCGLFFFLLGDIKTADDEADFMFHSAGIELFMSRVTSKEAKEMLDELERCDALTDRILTENTTVEPGMLEILKKNDNFLSKEDLIYLGFMEREYELI